MGALSLLAIPAIQKIAKYIGGLFAGDTAQSQPNTALGQLSAAYSDKEFGTTYGQQNLMNMQYGLNNQLAQNERTWQEQMFNKMNEYSSPANQMALLRAAGLNPSLMYGQMSDMAASNPPSAGAGSVGLGSPQYGATPSSVDRTLADAQAAKLNAEAKSILTKLPKEVNVMDSTVTNLESITKLNKALADESAQRKGKIYEETQKLAIDNQYLSETLNARIRQAFAQEHIDAATAAYIDDNLEQQLKNAKAQMRLLYSQANLNDKQREMLDAQMHHLIHLNKELDAMRSYYEKMGSLIPSQKFGNYVNSITGAINAINNVAYTILSRGQGMQAENPVQMNPYSGTGYDFSVPFAP